MCQGDDRDDRDPLGGESAKEVARSEENRSEEPEDDCHSCTLRRFSSGDVCYLNLHLKGFLFMGISAKFKELNPMTLYGCPGGIHEAMGRIPHRKEVCTW